MPNYETGKGSDYEDSIRIKHLVKGVFKHGCSYRVYVTQVDKRGYESPKSDVAVVIVGDNVPPPVPKLSLDKSLYTTGCHATDETCDVYVEWDTPECDDLGRYQIFVWKNKPSWWKSDGVYEAKLASTADSEIFVGSAENSTAIPNCYAGRDCYIGIQALDVSRNASNLYIIKVHVTDSTAVNAPKSNNIKAEPQGVWAIKVTVDCPSDMKNVKAVQLYRDGQTRIASLIFVAGKKVQWVDPVDYSIGLRHYYTYKYLTFDGRESQMSQPSLPAVADAIDMKYINEAEMKAFLDAWSDDGLEKLKTLKETVSKFKKTNDSLASKLSNVKKDYKEIVDKYTLYVNNFKQLSSSITQNKSTISSMRTSITQNSNAITLRAEQADVDSITKNATTKIDNWLKVNTKGIESWATRTDAISSRLDKASSGSTEMVRTYQTSIKQNENAIKLKAVKADIDTRMGEVRKQVASALQVCPDKITGVVTKNKGEISSSITQLKNACSMRVSRNNLKAEVDLAVQDGLSTAVIKADRVVVKGECLLQGDARIVGRFSADTLEIVDPKTSKPIWNSDVGTLKPFVFERLTHKSIAPKHQPFTFPLGPYGNHWDIISWSQFTPKPPVVFQGLTRVNVHIEGYISLGGIIHDGSAGDSFCDIYIFDTNGALPSVANNNIMGANVDPTPIAKLTLNGFDKYKRPGVYEGGRGWEDHTYIGETKYFWNNHYYETPFSIDWSKEMPWGKSVTVGIGIVRNDISWFETRTYGRRDVQWRITAS